MNKKYPYQTGNTEVVTDVKEQICLLNINYLLTTLTMGVKTNMATKRGILKEVIDVKEQIWCT